MVIQQQSPGSQPESGWSVERICAGGAAVVCSALIYGSLLPFDLRWPESHDPFAWMARVRFMPWPSVSRTDILTNITLGVLVGFFLMGAMHSGRRRKMEPGIMAALLVVSAASVLGTTVEFLQALSRSRDSSWNDVAAQIIGSAIGVTTWIVAGAAVIGRLTHLENEREPSRFVARLLQLFLPLYIFMHLTSSGVASEVTDLARIAYNGRFIVVPRVHHFQSDFLFLHNAVGGALVNIPIGALVALGWPKIRSPRRIGPAMAIGLSLVTVLEVAHGFVWSRSVSITEILIGALGVILGIAATLKWVYRRTVIHPGLVRTCWLIAAGVWTLMLTGEYWYPFDFQWSAELAKERFIQIPWVLFAAYRGYSPDPLMGLREALSRCLLGVPLGLLLRLAWASAAERSARRLEAVLTAGIATLVLFGIEIGQIFVPARFPDPADVLMGVLGAALGFAIGDGLARREKGDEGCPQQHLPKVMFRSFMHQRQNWRLLARFSMVGGTGVVVNLLVFWLLMKTSTDPHGVLLPIVGSEFNVRWYHGLSTVAFLVANLWNFQLNRSWAFQSAGRAAWLAEYGPFLAVGFAAQALGLLVMTLLLHPHSPVSLPTAVFGSSSVARTRELWAQMITIGVVTPVSFLGNKLWTFRAVLGRRPESAGSSMSLVANPVRREPRQAKAARNGEPLA